MKKIVGLLLILTLLFSTVYVAFAKQDNGKRNNATSQANLEGQSTATQQGNGKQNIKNQKAEAKAEKKTEKKAEKKQEQKTVKQTFKINGSPVIKYGKYKLPIRPITQGLGAVLTFNKETAVLTVTKATTTIVIDFKNKTVTVNGVVDTNSGIFTASNSKKSTVLIKYIANKLGARVTVDGNKVITETPGSDDVNVATGSAIVVSGSAITAN